MFLAKFAPMFRNMFKGSAVVAVLLAVLSLAGCSTELDINAPYKEFTVIYGVLDKDETVHLIKINKSFLGEGNALDMAQVRDSSEYTNDELEAFVHKIENGQITETYSLNDTVLTERVPGTFYFPDQTLYTFTATLDQNAEYELEARVRDKTYRARTVIVNDFQVNASIVNANFKFSFYNNFTDQYIADDIEWRTGEDGRRYVAYYRFNYREVTATDTFPKSFTRRIGQRIAPDTDGNDDLSLVINGEDFFSSIPNLVAQDPDVTHRIFDKIDLIWEVANDDLHVYMQLNEPVTGIVEDRPPFTNVDNDGLGILVSRTTKTLTDKNLRDPSIEELITGPYTASLNFCSQDFVGPPFGCP